MPKPTEIHNQPLGVLDRSPNAGDFVAEGLKEFNVEYIFGVTGGHEWPWLDPIVKSGVKQVTVHHEQTAGYAAEAYSRVSGKVGVCNVTVGPGGTNIFTAVHQAYLSQTPMLVLNAGHECSHDGMNTLQESYTEKYYTNITKLTKRIISNAQYKYWIRRAMEEVCRPPRGPAVLDFELEALVGKVQDQGMHLDNWLKQPMKPAVADPEDVARLVKLIYEAERPAMFVGDGIMWARASKELMEFAELAQVPVMGRRGGRGAIPEDHPLCYKSDMISQSDLFINWGGRLDFYDAWGSRWKIDRCVQVHDDPQCIHSWLNTELAINACPGAVLKQVIAYIKENRLEPPKNRADWIKKVQETEAKRRDYLLNNAQRFSERAPIHGLYLAKVTYETLTDLYNNDVLYCGDSFTGWNLMSPYVIAKTAGGVFDSGQHAGVGHGIGQAIGGALGTDRKKVVFAMMGDAGMGNSGMDIETAVRWKLPIVFCVYNNDMWLGDNDKFYGANYEFFPPECREPRPNYFQENIRYDKMFEYVGCHGEWVTRPDELRPALERACRSAEKGQPAVVNVDVSNEPIQSIIDSGIVMLMYSHMPWNEITNIHKKMRRRYGYYLFSESFDKLGIEEEKYDRYERVPGDFDIEG
jgi:acetolactate synthase-1/2/3 large subunit